MTLEDQNAKLKVTNPTIEDLTTMLGAVTSWAEKGRLARLITARREEAEATRVQELSDECSFRECELRELHKLGAAQVQGVCSFESLIATGHGLLVVRELSTDNRRAAINAFGRVDSTESAGIFLSDPVEITNALLRCALYPDPKTPEGALQIQAMVNEAFPLAHAGYKKACIMAGLLASSVSAKSGG